MPQTRKILLADPDPSVLRELARALRERQYQVSLVTDGSRALEVAVLRHPDLVLFDEACRLVEVRTFIQILRTNPRTEDIPVVVTGSSTDVERTRSYRDGYLRKPYNLDEVLGRIAHLFRKADAAKELKHDGSEIQGSLKQIGLPDLLQILSVNRRSGRLLIEHAGGKGEIQISDGRPVQARTGPVEGEKALFRLFGVHEGSFAFSPGTFAGQPRIQRGMEEALLEGLRQADEGAVILQKLPPANARLKLAPDAALGGGQHPVTAEVTKLLLQSRTVAELLDLATSSDFEVLAALKALLDKGLAELAPVTASPASSGPLLSAAEMHALRARILRGRAASREAVGKIVLCSDSLKPVRAFLDAVSGLEGYRVQRAPTAELLGTWSRIEFPDSLRVELCSIPSAEEARPLWRPFAAGALGAIALDVGKGNQRLAEYFARENRVPMVVLSDAELPAALRAPSTVRLSKSECREGLRVLLSLVSRQAAA